MIGAVNKFKWQVAIVFLLVLLVVLSFSIENTRKDLEQSKEVIRQTSLFLNGELAVEGYACGILNSILASELIGNNTRKNFSQIPQNQLHSMSWQDSCRYTDVINSEKYVQLFINTYQTREQTRDSYEKFFQLVNDNVSYPAEPYGEELVYDAGVFYLLQEKRIIRVAASNGNPSDAEQFARSVFERVVPALND